MGFSVKLDFLHVSDITHMLLFTVVQFVFRLASPCRQSLVLY